MTLLLVASAAAGVSGCTAEHRQEQQASSSTLVAYPETIRSSEAATTKSNQSALPEPAFRLVSGQPQLDDLGLVFHEVKFSNPIDGRDSLGFSETEITNQMFAWYLNDSKLERDDQEFEQAVTRAEEDGTASLSTSSPHIDVRQKSTHWSKGTFPVGQEEYPVTLVTTEQASGFARWLNARYGIDGDFRLPTEAEWLEAAYGSDRQFPWGDDEREWQGTGNEPVTKRPHLRTPDGLYGMWGNVAELVLSSFDGYGGKLSPGDEPMTTTWMGTSFEDEKTGALVPRPRQDNWGYTHSTESRSDQWGFRVVFVPTPKTK